jgi:ATP-binding cassette subfamily B protein
VVSLTTNLLVSQFPALLAYTSKVIIDALATPASQPSFFSYPMRPVVLGSVYLVLLLLQYAGQVFLVFVNESLTEVAAKNIHRQIILGAIRLQGLSYFDTPAFHDRRAVLENTALYIPMNFVRLVTDIFSVVLTVMGMVVLLSGLHPLLAPLIILAAMPDVLTQIKGHRLHYEGIRETAGQERLKEYYRSVLLSEEYAKEVRIYDLRTRFIEKYRNAMAGIFEIILPIRRSQIRNSVLSRFLLSLVTILTYLWAIRQAMLGHISAGRLVMFMTAIVVIHQQMSRAAQTLAGHQDVALAARELLEWLRMKPDVHSLGPGDPLPRNPLAPPGITIENVWFKYPGATAFTLKGLSLEIKRGKSLAIVGKNGSGKTTLVKLLCRLYDPQEGAIYFDGMDSRRLKLEDLRDSVAIIFQDYLRYQLTVGETISLNESDDVEIARGFQRAAAMAGAERFIWKLPLNYKTLLGRQFDNGIELSGGEWQHLALARAFYRQAGMLILDEPTASLDIATEAAICAQFKAITEGKTALLISHRLSTVRIADYIAVIEDGKVVEFGDHESLMSVDGIYREMFTTQAERYRLREESSSYQTSVR